MLSEARDLTPGLSNEGLKLEVFGLCVVLPVQQPWLRSLGCLGAGAGGGIRGRHTLMVDRHKVNHSPRLCHPPLHSLAPPASQLTYMLYFGQTMVLLCMFKTDWGVGWAANIPLLQASAHGSCIEKKPSSCEAKPS